MTKHVDFEEIGKKVPYRVPDGFFNEMQQQVMAQVEQPRRRSTLFVRISSAVIGVAAVVSAFIFLPKSQTEPDPQPRLTAEQNVSVGWVEQLSDDELQDMDDFSDFDIFMN